LRGLSLDFSRDFPIKRSQVHLTSAAVNGLPSCHLMPWRSLKVSWVLPSSRFKSSVLSGVRPDSPLEGAGFEPSVPRSRKAIPFWRKGTGEGSWRRQEAVPTRRVPEAGPHGAPRAAASVRLSAEG